MLTLHFLNVLLFSYIVCFKTPCGQRISSYNIWKSCLFIRGIRIANHWIWNPAVQIAALTYRSRYGLITLWKLLAWVEQATPAVLSFMIYPTSPWKISFGKPKSSSFTNNSFIKISLRFTWNFHKLMLLKSLQSSSNNCYIQLCCKNSISLS